MSTAIISKEMKSTFQQQPLMRLPTKTYSGSKASCNHLKTTATWTLTWNMQGINTADGHKELSTSNSVV